MKGRFVPAISTIEKTLKITGNFGERPFEFDVESHGYGNESCDKCFGSGNYPNDWLGREYMLQRDGEEVTEEQAVVDAV